MRGTSADDRSHCAAAISHAAMHAVIVTKELLDPLVRDTIKSNALYGISWKGKEPVKRASDDYFWNIIYNLAMAGHGRLFCWFG